MNSIRKHLPDVVGLACAALWPWVYYLPVTLGQQVFAEGDINWLFSPIRTELARALGEGSLPLWTPGLEGGFPLFAEGEVAALYPVNVIAYRLFPVYVANSYTILFNFMWASIGMYLLARSSRWRTASALVAAFAFSASGFMAAQLSHLPHVAAASWLPWLVLFSQRYWHNRLDGRRAALWFVLASFSIGLVCLAGFPQMAMINIAVYALCGFFGPVLWGVDLTIRGAVHTLFRWLPRAAIVVVSSVFLGLGIGSAQLLPTFELMGFSIRAQEMGESFFTSFSLDPSYLSQFLLPFWQMGAPGPLNMEYWGYIGVLPILLVLAAIVLRPNWRTGFFVFLALLAIALALGGNTPLYQWLYYVPLINRLRVPSRFLFLFTFAAAYLAGIGLEAMLERMPISAKLDRLGVACAAVFLALCGGVIFEAYNQPIEVWMGIWQWLPVVLITATIGLVLLIKFGKPSAFLLATLVLGFMIFDLAAFRAPFLQTLSSLALPSEWIQAPRTVQSMDDTDPIYRVLEEEAPWTLAAARGSMWNNLALLYGKQGVKSYLPSLGLQRNQTYVDEMTPGMRNLMNIRYYLLPLEPPDYDASIPSPFDQSEPNGGLTIDLLSQQPAIPATRVTRLGLVSYTDHTGDLPDGQLVGEIELGTSTGQAVTLPIRIGEQTADWDWEVLAESGGAKHQKPAGGLGFPAYLKSFGKTFTGYRYQSTYTVSPDRDPLIVTSVGVRSLLPGADLTIEHIDLIDDSGQAVSLTALLHRNDFALAFRSHTAAMWENRDVLPRAFIVHAVETMSDEEALARLKEPDYSYTRLALLSESPSDSLSLPIRQQLSSDAVTIVGYAAQRVVIRAQTAQPGYLVLTDSWYPGWVTTVDDQPAPMYRADYMFRAVELPPGEHTVTFEYRPVSFYAGAIISGLGLLIATSMFVILGVRARSG